MAKYMLIMRASDESAEKFASVDFAELLEGMGRFNDELIRAGVLLGRVAKRSSGSLARGGRLGKILWLHAVQRLRGLFS